MSNLHINSATLWLVLNKNVSKKDKETYLSNINPNIINEIILSNTPTLSKIFYISLKELNLDEQRNINSALFNAVKNYDLDHMRFYINERADNIEECLLYLSQQMIKEIFPDMYDVLFNCGITLKQETIETMIKNISLNMYENHLQVLLIVLRKYGCVTANIITLCAKYLDHQLIIRKMIEYDETYTVLYDTCTKKYDAMNKLKRHVISYFQDIKRADYNIIFKSCIANHPKHFKLFLTQHIKNKHMFQTLLSFSDGSYYFQKFLVKHFDDFIKAFMNNIELVEELLIVVTQHGGTIKPALYATAVNRAIEENNDKVIEMIMINLTSNDLMYNSVINRLYRKKQSNVLIQYKGLFKIKGLPKLDPQIGDLNNYVFLSGLNKQQLDPKIILMKAIEENNLAAIHFILPLKPSNIHEAFKYSLEQKNPVLSEYIYIHNTHVFNLDDYKLILEKNTELFESILKTINKTHYPALFTHAAILNKLSIVKLLNRYVDYSHIDLVSKLSAKHGNIGIARYLSSIMAR